jgi:hypothetical protein
MENAPYQRAVAEADDLLADGYVPLGASLARRDVYASRASYQLTYRSWSLEIELRARSTPTTSLATQFTCTMLRRGRLERLSRAAIQCGIEPPIVGPVLLGSHHYEGCSEALAAVYDKVIHLRRVQHALRRTGPVST